MLLAERSNILDMIYLHKILSAFLLPVGVVILLVLAGLVLRRRALCWTGIVLLWLGSTPLVGDATIRAAEGWQARQKVTTVPQGRAIVVLSEGRIEPEGDPAASEWRDGDRFFGGVELFKAGKAPLLVFTGGWAPWSPNARPEGDVLGDYAVELGVPRDRIVTTGKVVNTDEEARAVARLLAERGSGPESARILLVTSAFHMRRAQMLFGRAGIETVPYPVDFKVSAGRQLTLLDLLPTTAGLQQTETALRELHGTLYYWLVFRLS